MSSTIALQDPVLLTSEGGPVSQPLSGWIDAGDANSVALFADIIAAATLSPGQTLDLAIETAISPGAAPAEWLRVGGITLSDTVTAPENTWVYLSPFPQAPAAPDGRLLRYLRWTVKPAGFSTGWYMQFKVHATMR